MTIDFRSLWRNYNFDYRFEMFCPFCPEGLLIIDIDPKLKSNIHLRDEWGIRTRQCSADCACPLTDAQFNAIVNECERRAGLRR